MLKNYITVAIRALIKNRVPSLINIFGVAIGFICFTLILLFVKDELSYDRYHHQSEQVYRVVKDFVNEDGSTIPDATTPPALAPALQKDLPEVAYTTRLFPGWGTKYLLRYGEKHFYEEKVMRVDSSFFDVFTFTFIQGDKKTALKEAKSIVLTQSAAAKYMGNENPMGKTIFIDGMGDFIISGVLKDVPKTSHFTFDFLIPFRTIDGDDIDSNWDWYNFYTYIRLKDEASPGSFEAKLQPLYKKYCREECTSLFYAQALTSIHLNSHLKWELGTNGDASYVKILSVLAIFVIIIAGINYVNLATAQSAKRAKEVGIRKVMGAYKSSLVRQFLSESLLTAFIAFFISILGVQLLLPLFNGLMERELALFTLGNGSTWLILLSVIVLIGLLAGLYPAFYLASFEPVKVLKGSLLGSVRGVFLRKGLVALQFVISITLIVGTLIIFEQLNFIQHKKLGFKQDNIVILPGVRRLENKAVLINKLQQLPEVISVGGADGIIGGQNWANSVTGKGLKNEVLLNFLDTDFEFLKVLEVDLKEGRHFSKAFGKDTSDAIILNETAVKQLGLGEPAVGKQIIWAQSEDTTVYATVIGVIKDFHFTSFHEPIKPFGFLVNEKKISNLFVKVRSNDLSKSLASVRGAWEEIIPDRPFEYSFQDEQVQKLHQSEAKFQLLFSYLTIWAILIACFGLFGLALFTAEQRNKEIGVRKVLGASVTDIIVLLSSDFLKLVCIAFIIATPIAWYAMHRWLEGFAYRIEIAPWIFALAGIAAISIAFLTVSYQSIKAALANPVKSLRSE